MSSDPPSNSSQKKTSAIQISVDASPEVDNTPSDISVNSFDNLGSFSMGLSSAATPQNSYVIPSGEFMQGFSPSKFISQVNTVLSTTTENRPTESRDTPASMSSTYEEGDDDEDYIEDVDPDLDSQEFLQNFISSKLGALMGQSSGYVESLEPEIREKLTQMEDLQKLVSKTQHQVLLAFQQVHTKYQNAFDEIYSQRSKLIKEIPKFWLSVMQNSPVLEPTIESCDHELLSHLTNITSKYFMDSLAFQISFHFSPNEFIENPILSKRYNFEFNSDAAQPSLSFINSTEITWIPGHCITFKNQTDSKDQIPVASFFHFFVDSEMDPTNEPLITFMEKELEMGKFILDEAIPNAIHWFTGAALGIDTTNPQIPDNPEEMMDMLGKIAAMSTGGGNPFQLDEDEDLDDEDDPDYVPEEEEGKLPILGNPADSQPECPNH